MHLAAPPCFLGLLLLLTAPLIPCQAQAQDGNVTFQSVEACRKFEELVMLVDEKSTDIDAILSPADDVDAMETLLAGIYEGTRIMLSYGRSLFVASDKYEDACKAALREGNNPAAIIRIYELTLTPTIRYYNYLVRVRDVADRLGDTQTRDDMTQAIEGYTKSMQKLVGFCQQDLPKDLADKLCEDLRKQIDERIDN